MYVIVTIRICKYNGNCRGKLKIKIYKAGMVSGRGCKIKKSSDYLKTRCRVIDFMAIFELNYGA
jgi:hypothetical protein